MSRAPAALFAILLCWPASAQTRAPAAEALAPARKAFRAEHASRLRSKDTKASRRFAAELQQQANRASGGSAERFVLLDEAVTAFARGADPLQVRSALEKLAAEFAIARAARAAKAVRLLASRKHPAELRVACSDLAADYAGVALFAADKSSCSALLRDAKKLVAPLKLKGLEVRIKALAAIARAADKLRAAEKRARTALAKKDTAAARRIIARAAFCFGSDRTAAAQALLEHGNAREKAAARTLQESSNPGPGGALWQLGEAEKDTFVRARFFAESLRHPGTHHEAITLRAWNDRIALRDDFRAKGAVDPALAAIDRHVDGLGIRRRAGWQQRLERGPDVTFVPGRRYVCELETNLGTMRLLLLPDSAPAHVASFAFLAACGYYDGLGFHRIITDFMAQGGCCSGDGTGHPTFRLDTVRTPGLVFDRPGTLALANEEKPKTESAQFFITFAPTPHLNGKHTILGHVVTGMDTLQKIAGRASKDGKPTGEVRIVRARVRSTTSSGFAARRRAR